MPHNRESTAAWPFRVGPLKLAAAVVSGLAFGLTAPDLAARGLAALASTWSVCSFLGWDKPSADEIEAHARGYRQRQHDEAAARALSARRQA